MRNPEGTLKTHGTHYMFCGTLGFRGTPVEEHWFRLKVEGFKVSVQVQACRTRV